MVRIVSRALARAAQRAGVVDERIIDAMRDLDRAPFLPEDLRHRADDDGPVPIGHEQTASQPSLQARMLEALQLTHDDTVLEVGTGAGYQTALLARLAARVVSVEIDADLAARARDALAEDAVGDVHLVVGDGLAGWPAGAPYDAMVVSFTIDDVPDRLAAQLRDGGRIVAPIASHDDGDDPYGRSGRSDVTVLRRVGDELVAEQVVCGAYFVAARSH